MKSEDQARQLLQHISEGFIFVDADFRIMTINAEGERIEGRPAAALIGTTLWESWPELRDSPVGELWMEAMEDRLPVALEHHYSWPDGRQAWLEMRAYPSGSGLAIFFRDVTPRKQAEAALLETQRRLDAVLDNASVAIFLMDERKHCSYMNPAAERLIGYRLEEISGVRLHDAIHHVRPDGTPLPIEQCPINRAFDENRSSSGEVDFVHKDGHFIPVAYTASPIRDDGKMIGTIVEARDIGREKAAQADLQHAQSELIHASRISAMGAMASTLAHELSQPLSSVMNYVEAARKILRPMPAAEAKQARQALGLAGAAARRASEILRRLRAFVSKGKVEAEIHDLHTIVADACVLMLPHAQREGVEIQFNLDRYARWVMVDAVQIQQVLINLVRNAIEAMADSEKKLVTIGTAPAADASVEVMVADSGPGLADGDDERLFSPFNSSKAEGLGVGLSISRTIVEAHGGTLVAERPPGGGAVFRFTLPRASGPA